MNIFHKNPKTKDYLRAISVMVGYIVGVGMFGLPFVVAKAGVLTFVVMILLFGVVQYFLHLVYANLVVATRDFHRLPGYAGVYLGVKGKYVLFAAKMFGNFGALLAYLIITGVFMHQLLSSALPFSEFFYGTALFAVTAVVVYLGLGMVANFELVMSALLLFVVLLISVKGVGAIESANFDLFNWAYFLLPYGAILMALDGLGSVPIVAKLLHKNPKAMKKVIFWGTLIPVVLTIFFVITIVGITGANTSPDSLAGVSNVLDGGVIVFSLIFGILSMATSYILVTEAIKETLSWDMNISPRLSWAIAVFVPYIFYILGVTNLTRVISFAGGVAGSLSAIMLILVFRQLEKRKHHLPIFKVKPSTILLCILAGMFVVGALYEIFSIF